MVFSSLSRVAAVPEAVIGGLVAHVFFLFIACAMCKSAFECFTLYIVYFRCNFFITPFAFCEQQSRNFIAQWRACSFIVHDNKHFES